MDHPAMAIILPALTIWIFTKRSVLRWCGGLGWGAGLIVGIPIFPFYLIRFRDVCRGSLVNSLVYRQIQSHGGHTMMFKPPNWREELSRGLIVVSIVAGFIVACIASVNSENPIEGFFVALVIAPFGIFIIVGFTGWLIVETTRWIAKGFKSDN